MNELFPKYNGLVFINKKNERNIQAEIYFFCKNNNIPCHLEIIIPTIGRLDAVIIINNKSIIIECKTKSAFKQKYLLKQQLYRYKKLKCPIVVINDLENVEKSINSLIKKEIKKKYYIYSDRFNDLTVLSFKDKRKKYEKSQKAN